MNNDKDHGKALGEAAKRLFEIPWEDAKEYSLSREEEDMLLDGREPDEACDEDP